MIAVCFHKQSFEYENNFSESFKKILFINSSEYSGSTL